MAAEMTYTSLVEDIEQYAERDDTDFIAQIPRFIMTAENRIASEARGLGFMKVITDNLIPNQQELSKPARWRETVSFQIGTGAGDNNRVFLRSRSYEFCRMYWPNATVSGTPRYYADWDYEHWLIAPTPSDDFPYEIIFHERPEPLDATVETNWTTKYAPQLILYASLLEAQPYLKRDDRMQLFTAEYDRALKQVAYEQSRRMMDRTASVVNA